MLNKVHVTSTIVLIFLLNEYIIFVKPRNHLDQARYEIVRVRTIPKPTLSRPRNHQQYSTLFSDLLKLSPYEQKVRTPKENHLSP